MRMFVALAVAVIGCSSAESDKDSSFTCAMGSLTGTWRTHYTETNGDCGPIPDETNVFNPGKFDPACTVRTNKFSADKCRWDADWSCPTTDKQGTQAWVMVTRQTGSDKLESSATVTLSHPTGVCRSTYTMSTTRL